PSTVTGNVYEYSSGQYSGAGTVSGSIIVAPTTLDQNNADVQSALDVIEGLNGNTTPTPTQTLAGDISTATTINGNGGVNYILINGSIKLNNVDLTLNGSAANSFVIR